MQIRPDIWSGLIWNQTVCEGYQQTAIVGKELTPTSFNKDGIPCIDDIKRKLLHTIISDTKCMQLTLITNSDDPDQTAPEGAV